ncbi:hypothetical protein [Gangjinia marincola]
MPEIILDCVRLDTSPFTIDACFDGAPEITDPDDLATCQRIADLINNPSYQAKAQECKDNFGGEDEKGFIQNTDGTFVDAPVSDNGHTVSFPTGADKVGYIHNHLNDKIYPDDDGDGIIDVDRPIRRHSPADINTFVELLKIAQNTGRPVEDIYGSMYSSSGNFQLRFSGDPSTLPLYDSLEIRILTRKYLEYFQEDGDKSIRLLRFTKDSMDLNGIELWKINDNGKIKKLSLDADGKLKKEKCPN